ncbi:hypothetical protein C8J56DRAFT_1158332 [Mycena floridula]|nr:hypothetical protein C8J56DRAFT_1158332 [Mycena floridula]
MDCSVVHLNAYMLFLETASFFFSSRAVVEVFWQELTRNQAIIRGSFALQYFSRSFFPSSDMDVYISVASAQGMMQSCLRAGYHECPRPQETRCWMDCLEYFEATGEPQEGMPRGILDLYNEDRKNIQVVIVPDSPFSAVIGFHSTAVMNFITGHKAVRHLGSG